MEQYFELLLSTALFEGFTRSGLLDMLGHLAARRKSFRKNEVIFWAGQPVGDIGVVLEGSVRVVRDDLLGNRHILAELGPGNLFAEAFACAQVKNLPVTAVAAADCTVLFLDYRRMVTGCSDSCALHARLIANMITILAQRNILLHEKFVVLSQRTTREKLLAYLSRFSRQSGGESFVIPFNRQELADYLGVDRSAMSTELGRLRDEGLIDFDKSRFWLHAAPGDGL